MQSLLSFQRTFAADLRNSDSRQLTGQITRGSAKPAQLFNIYRNNIRSAQSGALAQVYPVIKELVGNEFFNYVAEKFIARYPLSQGNFHQFGASMAKFLQGFKPVAHLPYLGDVARLEWAYHRVFHAESLQLKGALFVKKLSQRALLRMHFKLGTACRLVRSTYPIFKIWKLHCDTERASPLVNLDSGPEAILIVRLMRDVELHLLAEGWALLLDSLNSGENLGTALEAALAADLNFDLPGEFFLYIQSGVLEVGSHNS